MKLATLKHGGRDGTLWYYRELAAIFTTAGPAAPA